jgi:O-acetyl-ADP-ribose deacetylase (regulator of RNase III)
LKKIVQKEKLQSLALPRLATGVGGLDWDQVKPLTQSQLGELGIPVYVYVVYHAGQEAEE